jgi:hypothetical protein
MDSTTVMELGNLLTTLYEDVSSLATGQTTTPNTATSGGGRTSEASSPSLKASLLCFGHKSWNPRQKESPRWNCCSWGSRNMN